MALTLDTKAIAAMMIPVIITLTVLPVISDLVADAGLTGVAKSMGGVIVLFLALGLVLLLTNYITNGGVVDRAKTAKERARELLEEED